LARTGGAGAVLPSVRETLVGRSSSRTTTTATRIWVWPKPVCCGALPATPAALRDRGTCAPFAPLSKRRAVLVASTSHPSLGRKITFHCSIQHRSHVPSSRVAGARPGAALEWVRIREAARLPWETPLNRPPAQSRRVCRSGLVHNDPRPLLRQRNGATA
jgi:hypothetical protein